MWQAACTTNNNNEQPNHGRLGHGVAVPTAIRSELLPDRGDQWLKLKPLVSSIDACAAGGIPIATRQSICHLVT